MCHGSIFWECHHNASCVCWMSCDSCMQHQCQHEACVLPTFSLLTCSSTGYLMRGSSCTILSLSHVKEAPALLVAMSWIFHFVMFAESGHDACPNFQAGYHICNSKSACCLASYWSNWFPVSPFHKPLYQYCATLIWTRLWHKACTFSFFQQDIHVLLVLLWLLKCAELIPLVHYLALRSVASCVLGSVVKCVSQLGTRVLYAVAKFDTVL